MNNRDHQSRIEQEQRTVSNVFLDIYVLIYTIIKLGYEQWTLCIC